MPAGDDLDDIWTFGPSYTPRPAPQPPALVIEQIDGVEPLDEQFGVAAIKTVPDALYDALFGFADQKEVGIEVANSDSARMLPLHTYAILDAAKVVNLAEMLECSGLEHRCLFKGAAYDDMKDVAPWVVRLEEDNSFTRNLFTRSSAPWHMWNAGPGIYLRSHGTLDDMWAHFRKFTRVQDENGKWFYFRFWETSIAHAFWTSQEDSLEHLAWRFGKNVVAIFWPTVGGFSGVRRPVGLPSGNTPKHAIDAYRPLFRAARFERFVTRVVDELSREGRPFDTVSAATIKRICDAARNRGFRSEAAIWDIARAMILFDAAAKDIESESQKAWGNVDIPDERVAARRLLAHAYRVAKTEK